MKSEGSCTDFTSPFNATVVEVLRSAGADIIGKSNCDEFGMGCVLRIPIETATHNRRRSLNTESIHGPVINPFQSSNSDVAWKERESRSAGGSSGGSAAAVAAGMCYA